MNTYILAAKKYLQIANAYVVRYKKQFTMGVTIVVVCLVVGIFAALFAYNNRTPEIEVVYQPSKACDMFDMQEAHELLGKDVINNVADPAIVGNTATSTCSYTNTSAGRMIVAAIAVRTGINDLGVQQNKDDFAAHRAANDTEPVVNVGDAAFFNKTNGKLNVLSDHKWIIINYGVGDAPQENTIEDAVKLANKVVDKPL